MALDAYTRSHATGVQIGANDGFEIYGVRVRDALHDVLIQKLPDDPWAFYGLMSRIDGRLEEVDGYRLHDLHFVDTDRVPGAETLAYRFSPPRSAANGTVFADVRSPPFNAKGDGSADDTASIQAALDVVGRAGGGTVYLRQGQYRVTQLVVPSGVELRGPLGGDSHSFQFVETCTLLGYGGRNTSNPASDTAMITLEARAGIRGFDIVYPAQGFETAGSPIVAYPFTIRGAGDGVSVENITVANAYNLIDLATFRCDHHRVSGVQAAIMNTGVLVGGGSRDGVLERIGISWACWAGASRLTGPLAYGADALREHALKNAVPFVFGDCSRETTFGLDSFEDRIGWRMLADGGGCTD